METCPDHIVVVERITKVEAITDNNVHRLDRVDYELDEIKKVHNAILGLSNKFDSVDIKISHLDSKIDIQQDILKGQVELFKPQEKSIRQIIIETVIPLMVYGSIGLYFIDQLKGVVR